MSGELCYDCGAYTENGDCLCPLREENQRLRERVGEIQSSLADFKLYLKTTDVRNRASQDGSSVYGLVLGVFDKKFPEIECKKSMRHEDRDGGLSYMETPHA